MNFTSSCTFLYVSSLSLFPSPYDDDEMLSLVSFLNLDEISFKVTVARIYNREQPPLLLQFTRHV